MSDYLAQFHKDSLLNKIKNLEKESYTRFFSAYFYNDSIIGINSQIDLLHFSIEMKKQNYQELDYLI